MSTVRFGSKFEDVFLLLLTILLCDCTSETAADPVPEPTTSEQTGTTDEPVPTTGVDAPEGSSSGDPDATSSTGAVDESTGGSSSTGPSEPLCGDGIVEGSEQCDEGYAANKPEGACLSNCVLATCGDGVVQEGVEECDPGDAEEVEYGGCLQVTCKWGPRCGDGHVDAPHEVCDPGDPNGQGDELVGCAESCRFNGRIVFITSESYSGALGGVTGADDRCKELAAAFDSNNADRYVAWVSDAGSAVVDRVTQLEDTPYVLRSGVKVADSLQDLLDNRPQPGIDLTDTYEVVTDVVVWTGTHPDGTASADNCLGWTSGSESTSAQAGRNRLMPDSQEFGAWLENGHWTEWKAKTCELGRRLYCFEN